MAVSKEDFLKLWKDSSREDILNQYYYDYTFTRELCDKVNKAIEQIEEQVGDEIHDMMYVIDVRDVLDILKGEENEKE